MGCLSAEEIDAWTRGALDDDRRAILAAHVEECERCRTAIEDGTADAALFEELRAVARTPIPGEDVDVLEGPGAIPGYRIEAEVHRGGQGVVYRAVQEATHRTVALKVLLRGRHASSRDRARFEREVDLASRLRHPDIVTIFDSGIADGRPFYAMELVEGQRLDAYLTATKPSFRRRLELLQRIALAVAAAHRRGVIHRDLKPSNILVDEQGTPHVLDFGVAKSADAALGDSARLTATGEFMGTLAYAAPEQIGGHPDDVDTRCDVHALGLVLYEMLTGRMPYDVTGSVANVLHQIEHVAPADPSVLTPEVDGELRTILDTALAKDPGERYSSAEALAKDIGHYLANEPITARAPSTLYRLRKAVARNRLAFAVTALVTVLVAAGGLALFRERLRAERQSENAQLVQEILQDVLAAASPRRMGSAVTLLEVYEQAADRVETELRDAPDAQAAFHLTIGDTYRSLLMWREAERHLQIALDRYRGAGDADELELARCLYLQGLVTAELDPPRALGLQEEALDLRRSLLSADAPDIAASERGLAIAMLKQYDGPDEGARGTIGSLLRSAEARFARALGPRHPEVAATRVWLAGTLLRAGPDHMVEASGTLEEALSMFDEAGDDDPRAIDCLNELASLRKRQGRFEEAEALLDRSFELATRLFGHERDVELTRNYANLHYARGDYATSERLSIRAVVAELERWTRKRPGDEHLIADLQIRLLAATPPDDEPPYAEAFAYLRQVHGNGSFEMASWANGIALVLEKLGRGRAAVPLLEEALDIRCRAFGPDCPVRHATLQALAEQHVADERADLALPLLEEAAEIVARNDRQTTERGRATLELLERCRAAGSATGTTVPPSE